MTEHLETCELCGSERSATYTMFNVGVLGAALCPQCQKIARTQNFKTELSHMLATGNGDLDKFVKAHNTPRCKFCAVELKTSNWYKADQLKNTYRCKNCKKGHYPQKNDKKIDIGSNTENDITVVHKVNALTKTVIFPSIVEKTSQQRAEV